MGIEANRRLQVKRSSSMQLFLPYVSNLSEHEGDGSSGRHAFTFSDGVLILSDSRLLLMASKLNLLRDTIEETAAAVGGSRFTLLRRLAPAFAGDSSRPDACAWNLLLRRRQVFSGPSWLQLVDSPNDAYASCVRVASATPHACAGSVMPVLCILRSVSFTLAWLCGGK